MMGTCSFMFQFFGAQLLSNDSTCTVDIILAQHIHFFYIHISSDLSRNDAVAENVIATIHKLVKKKHGSCGKSLERAQQLRYQGDEHFARKKFEKAVSLYSKVNLSAAS